MRFSSSVQTRPLANCFQGHRRIGHRARGQPFLTRMDRYGRRTYANDWLFVPDRFRYR
jgi:hypothetical protein